jgi:hypothetical protein
LRDALKGKAKCTAPAIVQCLPVKSVRRQRGGQKWPFKGDVPIMQSSIVFAAIRCHARRSIANSVTAKPDEVSRSQIQIQFP